MRPIPSFAAFAPSLALLASCVGPAPQRPAPTPAPQPTRPAPPPPAPAPAAPTTVEWQYRPATPGNWSYRAEAAGSAAFYGPTAADARLTLRCDRASRRISLIRAGGGQTGIIVRTSYGATSWPATPSAGATPQIVAVRAASDPVLDQIAYSRGKIAVETVGAETLIIPAWAEAARVIEDCRG
ncbi:hypothetical protein [Sphingobium sp.]|uniref:hypothetical protein n=1 Tax=Sphingobium sp. TaxID=1912891 RepID=UPI0026142078|nr:hypothetical protein [Sphingobium sp.]